MGVARDIALIILGLQAMVMVLIPLTLLGGTIYGLYRLQPLLRKYLRLAVTYAEMAQAYVERGSLAIAKPLIRAHTLGRMLTTMGSAVINGLSKH